MTPTRMLANILAGMLVIQVILGGAATLLSLSKSAHVVWGVVSFVALLVLVYLVIREFGTKSIPFRFSLAAVVDYIIQGILGFVSFNSNYVLLVHLTNAFVLMALITMLIGSMMRTPAVTKTVSSASPP
jgi:heme A synthase